MRTWNLSWMNSSTQYDGLLFGRKCVWFLLIFPQILIYEWLLLVHFVLIRANYQKLNISAFQTFGYAAPVKVYVRRLFSLFLNFIQELCVLFIGPRVKKGKVVLLIGFKVMFERPLNPSIVVFLSYLLITMAEVLTLSLTLFHSSDPYSRYTGWSPSFRSRDCIDKVVLDFAYFLN